MRDILFKAKRKDNGKWIEGNYFRHWEKAYILFGTTNYIPNMTEVEPATICQFTGLVDMDGIKIWENDIVKFENVYSIPHIGRVRYYAGAKPISDNKYSVDLAECNKEDLKVLGNIFDNTELMEEYSR